MDKTSPLVYILLINWNAAEHTLACLTSLQSVSYSNYRVLIVDNASSDNSVDTIAAAYPNATLLRLPRNLGFTGANNIGFQYALERGADFVYLLNTDTWVDPGFLTQAIITAAASPSIGIVGSKVFHAARPDRLQFAGGHVNLTTGYNGRPFGYNQVDHGQYDHITNVDWVTGCAMMVSRACLQAINGFDDTFFAFHEDVDLCLRARATGFRVVMSSQSHVWHMGGGSTGGAVSALHIYYDVRNGLRLVQKHKPARNKALLLLRVGSIIGAHTLQVLLSGPTRTTLSAVISGVRDYYCGATGVTYSSTASTSRGMM